MKQLICFLFPFFLLLQNISQTTPDDFNTCLHPLYYSVEKNTNGLILMSKHLANSNCIQINTYSNEDLSLVLFKQNSHSDTIAFLFDKNHHGNFSQNLTNMTVQEMRSDLVYTDKHTHQTVIYLKTNLTEIILAVPFTFDYFELKKSHQKVAGMWLDVHPETNNLNTFNLIDYLFLVFELSTVMIIVDLGIVVVLLFNKYNLVNALHSKLMWVVLVTELLSLCYFLFRYQLYFWSVNYFLYYFLASILINVFSIGNTSVGVFLLTAIYEKHITQNVPVIKRIHRYMGYVSYLLMKISLIIKMFIFVVVIGIKPDPLLIGICLTFPLIWAFFFVFKIIKFYLLFF